MFKIIKKQKRASKDIPFYFEAHPVTRDYWIYVIENYISVGKMNTSPWQISEDGLEASCKTVWSSKDDFMSYITNEYCIENQIAPGQAYDAMNKIESELIIEE
jgi:hypothetical protein